MPFLSNKLIVKRTSDDNIGLVNVLADPSSDAVKYAAGEKFSDGTLDYYSISNINALYSNAVYSKNFDASIFCKSTQYSLTDAQITKDTNNKSASFDDLLTMMANTFIPLTNIRYSRFRIFELINDGTYKYTDYYGNAFLTNSAIQGTNSKSFANNINDGNSRKIISTKEDFFQYGNIQSKINALRNTLVQEIYPEEENPFSDQSKWISISTISTLSSYCVEALNNIRTNLSCYFFDSNEIEDRKQTVTYCQLPDGSGELSTYEYKKYSAVTISNYFWNMPSDVSAINGWSTTKNPISAMPEYAPGTQLFIDKDYTFYPSFTYNANTYTVTYHKTNFIYADLIVSELEGNNHIISGIGAYNSLNTDFRYKDSSSQALFRSKFRGYATSPTGNVVYQVNDEIIGINKNYDLYPIFAPIERTYVLSKSQKWRVGELEESSLTGTFPQSVRVYNPTSSYDIVKSLNSTISVNTEIPAKYASKIKFVFAGYINEQNCTHAPNADKQASIPSKVDKDGYAKVLIDTLKYGNSDLSNKLKKYTLTSVSIKNWYTNYVLSASLPQTIKDNLRKYYYNNSTLFSNKNFSAYTATKSANNAFNGKPILFSYEYINGQKINGVTIEWPSPKNNNGTLNCFSTVRSTIAYSNVVLIETNWIDINSSDNSSIVQFKAAIAEKCSKKGSTNGKWGGSIGEVFLTNISIV